MITMCDYYGMCDAAGRCVGHPVKVTMEYGRMLRSLGEEVRLVCSPCIADAVEADGSLFTEVRRLPYDISIIGNGIGKRIADKLKIFKNIRIALKDKGTVFFYQVDFFFFLYLKLFYKKSPDRKIMILIYHQDFTGGKLSGLLHSIYRRALGRIDGIIYTQRNAQIPHDNTAWMPDYIYRSGEYDLYRNKPKADRVVALGTMNRYKQIEELIDVWRMSPSLPELIIAGRFDSRQRYEKLLKNLPDGVIVRDELLDNDEYMTLLSGSKYSILPYDMEQYRERTSGILLESIYCGVIPIAPNALLTQNGLPGLGYDRIADVVKLPAFCVGTAEGSPSSAA